MSGSRWEVLCCKGVLCPSLYVTFYGFTCNSDKILYCQVKELGVTFVHQPGMCC